jgi:hypothetical protein
MVKRLIKSRSGTAQDYQFCLDFLPIPIGGSVAETAATVDREGAIDDSGLTDAVANKSAAAQ